MVRNLRVPLLLLLALLAATATLAAAPGEVAPLAQASLVLPETQALRGVDLYDGRARAPVKLIAEGKQYKSADGALGVAVQSEKLKDRMDWRVAITNRGQQNAWLLVRGYAVAPRSDGWKYFDGNFSGSPRRATVRTALPYTMPVVGVYSPAAGTGLALEPMQIFSYLENGLIPGATEHTFYYGVKLVIDPGKTETVAFVTFNCKPVPDERNFVAAYHALYPAAFSPIPDGDPRLQTRGEAGSAATWYNPSPEAIRRTRSGCDWCYAPVKIPGDWYGRPEFWNKYNENVTDEKKLGERYGTLEHWHQLLNDTFTRVDLDNGVAPYFYIINWSYYKLAEEHYPDSMVTDPLAQNRIGPWVTNKGPDVRVYLFGNKHTEQYHRDLTDIWNSYPLSGFGHDVAMGDVKFRGAGMAVSPGRAWDDEGEYVDVSVCIAKTGDFIHQLPKKQYRAGHWGNGADHIYSIAMRSDASSFESARYMLPGMDDQARYQRYVLGSKAIQLFSADSRDNTTQYYDPAKYSPEEIKLMYRRIELSSLQFCLKWGVLPCVDMGWGWQEGWELKDLADRELFPYPWQLVPTATVEGPAELAQYGKGPQARFVVMNPRGAPAEALVKIQVPAGQVSAVLYALADGTETVNQMRREVQIAVKLPPAGVAVLLPVATVPPSPSRPTCTVARREDPEDGLRLTLPQAARPLMPAGYEPAADSPLHLSRKLFLTPEKSLLDFFGTPEAIETPVIALKADASLQERKAAEAVQEYFRYYSEEVLGKPRVVLAIVQDAPAEAKIVRIGTGATATVALDATGKNLTIQAPPDQVLDPTRELLRLLDRRFPYYGQIGRWVHQRPVETELRKTLGLGGGTVLRDGSILYTPQAASVWNQVEKGPAYGKPW